MWPCIFTDAWPRSLDALRSLDGRIIFYDHCCPSVVIYDAIEDNAWLKLLLIFGYWIDKMDKLTVLKQNPELWLFYTKLYSISFVYGALSQAIVWTNFNGLEDFILLN